MSENSINSIINIKLELKKIELSQKEKDFIETSVKKQNLKLYKKWTDSIEDLYKMRFIIKCTTGEIAEFFNKKPRTIQKQLEKLNWHYSREEAQTIANLRGRRDYDKIQASYRITLQNKTYTKKIIENPHEFFKERLEYLLVKEFVGTSIKYVVGTNGIGFDSCSNHIPLIIIKENIFHVINIIVKEGSKNSITVNEDNNETEFSISILEKTASNIGKLSSDFINKLNTFLKDNIKN